MTPQAVGGKWRAKLVPVALGVTDSSYVEVKSGISEGQQVIYRGYEGLADGDPVVPAAYGPDGPLGLPPAAGNDAPGTVYTCLMHPQIRTHKPGNCPICGMALVPVKPKAADHTAGDSVLNSSPSQPAPKPAGSAMGSMKMDGAGKGQ